jgi:acetyl esterase
MDFVLTSAVVRRDLEYASPGGVSLRLDASIPEGSGPFPAVVIVHGGAWVRGDKAEDVVPLFGPLNEAGFAWFSINYRLISDWNRFGEAVSDVEAAIHWVREHATDYRVDPTQIAVIGESAGGQLAGMAVLGRTPGIDVQAAVLLYSPTDLMTLARTSAFVPDVLRGAARFSPLGASLLNRLDRLSPAQNVYAGMPPFLLIHGTEDPLVPYEQSRDFCDRARSVGAECELYPVPGAGHGIRWWESNGAIARPYKREMVRWLKNRLGQRLRRAS